MGLSFFRSQQKGKPRVMVIFPGRFILPIGGAQPLACKLVPPRAGPCLGYANTHFVSGSSSREGKAAGWRAEGKAGDLTRSQLLLSGTKWNENVFLFTLLSGSVCLPVNHAASAQAGACPALVEGRSRFPHSPAGKRLGVLGLGRKGRKKKYSWLPL